MAVTLRMIARDVERKTKQKKDIQRGDIIFGPEYLYKQ